MSGASSCFGHDIHVGHKLLQLTRRCIQHLIKHVVFIIYISPTECHSILQLCLNLFEVVKRSRGLGDTATMHWAPLPPHVCIGLLLPQFGALATLSIGLISCAGGARHHMLRWWSLRDHFGLLSKYLLIISYHFLATMGMIGLRHLLVLKSWKILATYELFGWTCFIGARHSFESVLERLPFGARSSTRTHKTFVKLIILKLVQVMVGLIRWLKRASHQIRSLNIVRYWVIVTVLLDRFSWLVLSHSI